MRVKSLLVSLITLTLALFVSACSGPDQQVDTDSAGASTNINQEQMPVADSTEPTSPDAAPAQDSTTDAQSPVASSDKKGFPAPQLASTNTVVVAAQTWDDAEDVMRSGRVLSESPVYKSPEAGAEVVGEHEAGELVIVTRSLDDWYEIIYNDGATRHAWLPQSAITFGALSAAKESDAATTTDATAEPTPAAQPDTEFIVEQVIEIVPVSAPAKTAAPASTEQGVIVFQTSSGGSIYSMNAEGSNLQLITTGGLDPALSPDGTQVAYARWDEPRGLFVVNIDGSDERRLVGGNFVKNPTWSPDGTRIAYNVQEGGREGKTITHPRFGTFTIPSDDFWRLEVIDVTGDNLEGIADNMHSWNPDWSEYGILYAAEDGIYVTSPDGGPHHIYDASNTVRNPAWSADGQTIIATMEFHDHWEVVRLNRDGTGLVRLDQNYDGVHSVAPTWSADGEYILYLSDRNGEWALWVMDADGGNKRPLAPGTLSDITFQYDFNAEQVADWR